MSFESLSETCEITINNFPQEWIPLTYLYDPDLPLFPIQYFHFLDPDLEHGHRPNERERLFGFIHHVNLAGNTLTATVAINKNLSEQHNSKYIDPLTDVITSRLGLDNPVVVDDIENALNGKLSPANNILKELWYQVVSGSFGNKLPFGKTWDPVFGLIRFVASWNSQGGRKGELIQTHDFCRYFGVKIQTGGGIHADYYLLPTYEELTDTDNPLSYFQNLSTLTYAASDLVERYCVKKNVNGLNFSSFEKNRIKTKILRFNYC